MKKKNKVYIHIVSLVSAIVVFVISARVGYIYITPTSYVSLNMNISIEYSLNAFDMVISTFAESEDGYDIIYGLNLENKNISEAIQETIDRIIENGKLSEGKNEDIIISVSNLNKDKAAQLVKELQEKTQKYVNVSGENTIVEAKQFYWLNVSFYICVVYIVYNNF